jgi:hypothetical protein
MSSLHHLRLPPQETPSILNSLLTWNSKTQLTTLNRTPLYNHFAWTEKKTPFPTIPLLLCLLICCLETGSPSVACMFISAGTFSPSRCLAMNYSGFQASCHTMFTNFHVQFSLYGIPFNPRHFKWSTNTSNKNGVVHSYESQ